MRRVVLASALVGMLLAVVVSAQPPSGLPALPPAPAPAADPVPPGPPQPLPAAPAVAGTETPLSRFDPLAAFPPVTQYSVRAVLLGSTWMAKRHKSDGRFTHGYNPALRQELSGDHDLRQAQAALAVAQAAKFAGDPKHSVVASQAVLTLLASTKVAPNDPTCRVPVAMSVVCNRVGFAAVLALAIYELPKADDKLIEDAERLCEFVRRSVRTDGSIHYTDGPNDVPAQVDPNGANEYPGTALQALAVSNRVRPADWKRDAVQRGVTHYLGVFRAGPHPLLAATVTPAATELYAQTKDAALAAAVFEMNDWLCTLQIGPTERWAGGFRGAVATPSETRSTAETGLLVQSLACGYQLTRLAADLTREAKYRAAAADAAHFVCSVQYLEENTRHFENAFRANMLIGAFHVSPSDGNLRIDATACAVTGLLRYLAVNGGR